MKLRYRLLIYMMFSVLLPISMTIGAFFGIRTIMKITPQFSTNTQAFVTDMLFCMILTLIVTSIGLTIGLYYSIVDPLRKLKEATNNIREGNLNFTIESASKDEIGELCNDFEAMRKQLKESEEEKLVHDREHSDLIRNISHDLKTPITSIRGYVEGILDGVADTPEKQERYLRTIQTKTKEMENLINELTLYAKIDTNRIPYDFRIVSLKDFFDDCVEEIELDLEQRHISLKYENFCSPDTKFIADVEQFHRVISNILNNSRKYIDKTYGHIRLTLKDVDNCIQIEIEDNGKGISKEDLPYIFDRFFRTDESRNSATGGSGIGLSIVKKIVEDHNGKIWATSQPGQGTCMFIILRKYEGAEQYE